MFELVKITDHYVFDRLTKTIYKVDTKNGKDVENYEFCCKLVKDGNGDYIAENRETEVAIGIIEKAKLLCEKMETA